MEKDARLLVIINQVAAKARRAWPRIAAALNASQIKFEAHTTTHAGDATERTRAALLEGYKVIAVVGGDGTLSEAAAGFFMIDENEAVKDVPARVCNDAALALLPAGTGDDFAGGLRGRRESLELWIDALVNHCLEKEERRARAVDVIYGSASGGAKSFICLNVATIGLGAEVARRVAAQGRLTQRLPGEARFVAAACGALAAWSEHEVRVLVDEEAAIECRSNLLAVANGIYAGGGMMFAPHASVDDGLLDVLISNDLTRATILRELPRIRRGAHLSNPNVRAMKAKRVAIETDELNALPIEADGNVRGTTPARFQIMPQALRIIF